MHLKEILKNIANDDGTFSEGKLQQVEELTGKTREELISVYEKEVNPVPDGHPSSWSRETKLKFIEEHDKDEYKRLVDERK